MNGLGKFLQSIPKLPFVYQSGKGFFETNKGLNYFNRRISAFH